MSTELAPIRGTRVIYGVRDLGGAVGVIKTEGASNELAIDITGQSLHDGLVADVVIPAGSIIVACYAEITEAFDVTGDLAIGTSGSEAVNGVPVTEAELEAEAGLNLTAALIGTWAAGSVLAADTTVGVAAPGTVVVGKGKGRVVVEYKHVV